MIFDEDDEVITMNTDSFENLDTFEHANAHITLCNSPPDKFSKFLSNILFKSNKFLYFTALSLSSFNISLIVFLYLNAVSIYCILYTGNNLSLVST